jgi:peptide/nickel transport system substrate-binding protein
MVRSASDHPQTHDAAPAISRRAFAQATGALSAGAALTTLAPRMTRAQGATPAATPALASERPDVGTDTQERGAGDELRLIVWQAPSVAAPHSGSGEVDFVAAAPVLEPLLHYLPDGTIISNLVTEVPSMDNGLLSPDLSTATFRLLPDVVWSDGEPFTSRDVQFTWQWIVTQSNASSNFAVWDVIEGIETPDDLTAVVSYKTPSLTWFDPFTGNYNGPIYPAHVFDDDPANKNDAFLANPIGTGPYVIETFATDDQVTYVMNEHYREPTKPYFRRVLLKGGGDPAAAARAVVQTGEFDFGWNVQIEPEVSQQIEADGDRGTIYSIPGVLVEQLTFNLSDPNTEVDGQRSQKDTPHPILSDLAVRQALSLAVQRDVMAERFYGEGQPPATNILTGLPAFTSPNTSWAFDPEQASQILDAAGWVLDGDVRAKDGVKMVLTVAAATSSIRQKEQAVLKENWERIGVRVEIEQIDPSIYFDGSPGNDQNPQHKYRDADIAANGPTSPIPTAYLSQWYAGPNGENIAQRENDWQRDNTLRWQNADYDALYESLLQETDFARAQETSIALNDLVIEQAVTIPLVQRTDSPYALGNRIRQENVAIGPRFAISLWNIANWNEVEG